MFGHLPYIKSKVKLSRFVNKETELSEKHELAEVNQNHIFFSLHVGLLFKIVSLYKKIFV